MIISSVQMWEKLTGKKSLYKSIDESIDSRRFPKKMAFAIEVVEFLEAHREEILKEGWTIHRAKFLGYLYEKRKSCDEECFWFRIGECNSKTKTCEKPEHYQTGSEDY